MIDREAALAYRFAPVRFEVERGRLRAFARAIGEPDPIYSDLDAARAAGHRDLPVPPTFFFGMTLEAERPFDYLEHLGVELGADPTAVYRYFRDLDALLIAITDRLMGEALEGFAPAAGWAASLRDMGERVHRAMQRHPRMALLMASRFTAGPHELRCRQRGRRDG